jgi:hypothetical protein
MFSAKSGLAQGFIARKRRVFQVQLRASMRGKAGGLSITTMLSFASCGARTV